MSVLKSNTPEGPLKDKWTNHKNKINLVNPANKRNIDIIVYYAQPKCKMYHIVCAKY